MSLKKASKLVSETIREYLKTAQDKIGSARILLEHEKFDDAVSRAYYAVFHCVQALLQSEGLKAESHSGARTLFSLHFIKSGKLDRKLAKYFKELKEERESGDYGILSLIDEEDARQSISEAEEFIAETLKYLKL